MFVHVCMRAFVYVHVCMCACVYMYVCMYVCVYVCMRAGLEDSLTVWMQKMNATLPMKSGNALEGGGGGGGGGELTFVGNSKNNIIRIILILSNILGLGCAVDRYPILGIIKFRAYSCHAL